MTNSAKRRPSIEAQTFLIIDLGFAAAIVISVFLVIFGPGLARAAFTGAPFSLVADTESGLTAVAGAAVVVVRLNRRLTERVHEWGTQAMFRTRLEESLAFLALGAGIVGLSFAGLFGDPGSVRLFHDSLDDAWVTSTFTIAYPLIVLCFVPTAWLGWRQLKRLRELEGDDAAEAPARSASEQTQVLRWAARGPSAAFVLASLPLMAALIGPAASPARVVVLVAILVALFAAKWRVERVLTERCAEWTTRPAQQSVAAIYGWRASARSCSTN